MKLRPAAGHLWWLMVFRFRESPGGISTTVELAKRRLNFYFGSFINVGTKEKARTLEAGS